MLDIYSNNDDYRYDAIVVGIGHAGVEAALSLARLKKKTLALSITLDNAGFLACNPSIGGTAKGHLVREVDALGGEMGKAADECLNHLRMLNSSKGPAVQSLRAQIDKYKYHRRIKKTLENEPNLHLRQGEVKRLVFSESGAVAGVETVTKLIYYAPAVILACGVYLDSSIIIGDVAEDKGPAGFARSNYLAGSLRESGYILRRFKTGTPARVDGNTVEFSKLEVQAGEDTPYSFSELSKKVDKKSEACYLGRTNAKTHEIIRENLYKSPKYSGLIHGAGARYCPSVEDKIVRFADKESHQFFLEPEGNETGEMYVQGLSTGLPADVQLTMYRSIEGFSNVRIMRDAYAIEYECIDPMQLFPTLMSKRHAGLFFAGQINGTSGYEEAAAQGLVAGINAARHLGGKEPLILERNNSYIGVLIDDLVTKGTDEPYRMMTSRAEFRLLLRQDNADERLTETGREAGLVDDKRYALYKKKCVQKKRARKVLDTVLSEKELAAYFESIGETPPKTAMRASEVVKRPGVDYKSFTKSFGILSGFSENIISGLFTEVKYEGYLEREKRSAAERRRLEKMPLSKDTDYSKIDGLRNEAKEKLNKIKPLTIGQASRISGVNPADINVLIIRLGKGFDR